MKKIIKNMSFCILAVFLLLCVSIFCCTIYNKHKTKEEIAKLEEYCYEKYSSGDYDLGVCRIGNKDSKHKLIALSGMGVNDYSIGMSAVNDILKDEYEIIYIDRAGYGFSDDTNKKQTAEQIVSDYRNALKDAGIEGPYILLPHSLGGIYATYWASEYPDEIEGVVFIDTSVVEEDAGRREGYETTLLDRLYVMFGKIGLQRLFLRKISYKVPSYCSDKDQEIADYLNIYSAATKAMLSESDEILNNFKFVYDNIKSNDIPKVFVNASSGHRTKEEVLDSIEWLRNRQKEVGIEPSAAEITEDMVDKLISESVQYTDNTIIPYLNSMGNTIFINLPGNHAIYEEKPEELAEIIREFIENIDNYKGDF
jgi:pimeloyl-ACP methyl ester carboxylesterase